MSTVRQDWLLLTANQDDFAPVADSRALFEAAPSRRKAHKTFDSGHALPRESLDEVRRWLQVDPGASGPKAP
ncbi:hypothetical protein LZ198_03160 [Myxococcus sp. K15C18031901]|uniref:hypothetical protein n=1 Tax=Myxococcus dinghuensis TaxID=2906761 RepID=UPI0020A7BD40|nr:hypothetical protein [Myxococcus dinghuensis]MCP3097870.1 hypothetical protein [Myxococcus dinghuensis]